MMFDKKALIEALKEPLRLLVLAILPFATAYFAVLPYQWAAVATVALRFIDKWLHEVEAAKPVRAQNDGLFGIKGLTGF